MSLDAALSLFNEIKHKELQGFAHIDTDPTRQELNSRLVAEVLGGNHNDTARVDDLTNALASEPTMTTRH